MPATEPDAVSGPHAPPEPGGPQNPVEISDPRALRALAHPARQAILEHLMLDGPATATECADVAGLSPSACSYHLRALAKYGFVEEDPVGGADRRHRPWRARFVAMTVATDPTRPAAVRSAGKLLVQSVRARYDEVRAQYLNRESQYPVDWQLAAGSNHDVMHVTPAELDLVRSRIYELLGEYRRLGGVDRPAGARRVQVTIDFIPWFDPPTQRGTRHDPSPDTCPPAGPGDSTGTTPRPEPAP